MTSDELKRWAQNADIIQSGPSVSFAREVAAAVLALIAERDVLEAELAEAEGVIKEAERRLAHDPCVVEKHAALEAKLAMAERAEEGQRDRAELAEALLRAALAAHKEES